MTLPREKNRGSQMTGDINLKSILTMLDKEDLIKIVTSAIGGNSVQQPVKSITLEEAIKESDKLAEFNCEPKTIELRNTANKKLLQILPGNKLLNKINENDAILVFKENKKTAPRGAYNYHKVYHAECNQFIKLGYIVKNPFDIKLPVLQEEEPVVIPDEEKKMICEKLREMGKPIISDMVEFGILSGLRLAEETFLRVSDVDLKNRLMVIGSRNFKTKTKRNRKIPLNDRMEKIIRRNIDRQLNKRKIVSEFVFAQNNGKPFQKDTVSKTFKRAVRAAGLSEDYKWKSLRSTAASNWVNRKVPLYTVQRLLGHSKPNTTARHYAKVNIDELRDAVEML